MTALRPEYTDEGKLLVESCLYILLDDGLFISVVFSSITFLFSELIMLISAGSSCRVHTLFLNNTFSFVKNNTNS